MGTINDELYCVINMLKRKIDRGDVVLELSIDTVNAINSLSWRTTEAALEHHTFSWYRRKEVVYYPSESSIEFTLEGGNIVQRGEWHEQELGPLLWNIDYNYTLEIALRRSVHLICNADDTLLYAGGGVWRAPSGAHQLECTLSWKESTLSIWMRLEG